MIQGLTLVTWLAPFLSFLLLVISAVRFSTRSISTVACLGPTVSFLAAIGLLVQFILHPWENLTHHVTLWRWIPLDDTPISIVFHIDPLTLVMLLTVTGVGTIIHVYSIGYMAGEKEYRRYFAYMNLFIFMMASLVMADSLPVLFIGWEGVGLCSYLLIGFWYHRDTAARAGMKAFVVNRIGDAGFLAGIFILGMYAHVWDWEGLSLWATSPMVPTHWLALATMTLFIGAIGKSAQIPLYVWLPDAMEGPTPVSALIHAATMVTAGVYMVVRLRLLFDQAPGTLKVVAATGLITALYAGFVALAHTEMKKILAFSTISQLGFMFTAAGFGFYAAAIFHLIVHAFFKALLFLATGSVMHACKDEQNIFRLGGLKASMPRTHALFLVGTLTLAGVPPLAAFFSKESILEGLYSLHGLGWGVATLAATVTALYAFRLYLLPFLSMREPPVQPHEAPRIMLVPLSMLAFLSIIGGVLTTFLPRFLGYSHVPSAETSHSFVPIVASLFTLLLAVGSIIWLYSPRRAETHPALQFLRPVAQAFTRQLGWNEFYDIVAVRPVHWLSNRVVHQTFDNLIIDGVIDGSAHGIQRLGQKLAFSQRGNVRAYAYLMILGAILCLAFYLWHFIFGNAV